jgi:hypothetical protein
MFVFQNQKKQSGEVKFVVTLDLPGEKIDFKEFQGPYTESTFEVFARSS